MKSSKDNYLTHINSSSDHLQSTAKKYVTPVKSSKGKYTAPIKAHVAQRKKMFLNSRFIGAGLAMAAAALLVRYKTRQAEEAHPPAGNFVEVDGVRLHYVEVGQGQPLVLLHGNTTMGMDFGLSRLVDMAAKNYRVIIFDRPGYGYSERPRTTIWGPVRQARLIHDALQKIGVEQPIVLGHSWGALVAIAMGLDFPQYVRGLVLLDGYYYPTVRPDVPWGAQPAIPIIGDIMRYTLSPLMFRMAWPAMLKRMFSPKPVPEHFKQFPAWMALRPGQIRAAAAEIAIIVPATMSLSKRYHELSVPTVIMAGSEDRLVYVDEHSARLHSELPATIYRLAEGVGHMVHHVAPEQVMDAIDVAENSATPIFQGDQKTGIAVHPLH
jgi:pimeloyl-ACP methyl ester carboxylesterase